MCGHPRRGQTTRWPDGPRPGSRGCVPGGATEPPPPQPRRPRPDRRPEPGQLLAHLEQRGGVAIGSGAGPIGRARRPVGSGSGARGPANWLGDRVVGLDLALRVEDERLVDEQLARSAPSRHRRGTRRGPPGGAPVARRARRGRGAGRRRSSAASWPAPPRRTAPARHPARRRASRAPGPAPTAPTTGSRSTSTSASRPAASRKRRAALAGRPWRKQDLAGRDAVDGGTVERLAAERDVAAGLGQLRGLVELAQPASAPTLARSSLGNGQVGPARAVGLREGPVDQLDRVRRPAQHGQAPGRGSARPDSR